MSQSTTKHDEVAHVNISIGRDAVIMIITLAVIAAFTYNSIRAAPQPHVPATIITTTTTTTASATTDNTVPDLSLGLSDGSSFSLVVDSTTEYSTAIELHEQLMKAKKVVKENASGLTDQLIKAKAIIRENQCQSPTNEFIYIPTISKFGTASSVEYELIENTMIENAMADDFGSTDHTWEQGKGLTNGIGKEEWTKQGTDWSSVRTKLLVTIRNILSLFDRILTEELFPHASVSIQNKQLFIRDGKEGQCIRVDRYYEYVQNSIIAQLGLGKPDVLPWARSVELSFEAIERAMPALRVGMLGKCDEPITVNTAGELSYRNGKPISVILPWPKDRSILLVHNMRVKKTS